VTWTSSCAAAHAAPLARRSARVTCGTAMARCRNLKSKEFDAPDRRSAARRVGAWPRLRGEHALRPARLAPQRRLCAVPTRGAVRRGRQHHRERLLPRSLREPRGNARGPGPPALRLRGTGAHGPGRRGTRRCARSASATARRSARNSPAKRKRLREIGEANRFLPVLFCSPTMELGVDISALNVVYMRNVPPDARQLRAAERSRRPQRPGRARADLRLVAEPPRPVLLPRPQGDGARRGEGAACSTWPTATWWTATCRRFGCPAWKSRWTPASPSCWCSPIQQRPLRRESRQPPCARSACRIAPRSSASAECSIWSPRTSPPRWRPGTPGRGHLCGPSSRLRSSASARRSIAGATCSMAAEAQRDAARRTMDDYAAPYQEKRAAPGSPRPGHRPDQLAPGARAACRATSTPTATWPPRASCPATTSRVCRSWPTSPPPDGRESRPTCSGPASSRSRVRSSQPRLPRGPRLSGRARDARRSASATLPRPTTSCPPSRCASAPSAAPATSTTRSVCHACGASLGERRDRQPRLPHRERRHAAGRAHHRQRRGAPAAGLRAPDHLRVGRS
jgi:hypothetical protein